MPTSVAPLYHWYEGLSPPFEGVAVNDTLVPAQTGLASGAMVTLTGKGDSTVIVISSEDGVSNTRQDETLEVISTFILSPSVGV